LPPRSERRQHHRINHGYKRSIHAAVIASGGHDRFTGEPLDWTLISTYDNAKSKELRRGYKATLAFLPTVDQVGDDTGPASFQICGWRTNDMKNDLACEDFVALSAMAAAVLSDQSATRRRKGLTEQ
jgi:hypothetical protein